MVKLGSMLSVNKSFNFSLSKSVRLNVIYLSYSCFFPQRHDCLCYNPLIWQVPVGSSVGETLRLCRRCDPTIPSGRGWMMTWSCSLTVSSCVSSSPNCNIWSLLLADIRYNAMTLWRSDAIPVCFVIPIVQWHIDCSYQAFTTVALCIKDRAVISWQWTARTCCYFSSVDNLYVDGIPTGTLKRARV